MTINWLPRELVLAIHLEQLEMNGGASGIRDHGLLDYALARPQQKAAYGTPDIAYLAAAYSYGIARNHPFIDGNMRTAFVSGGLFMELNGYEMTATEADVVLTFLALAAGEMSEEALADWYRAHTKTA